MRRMLQRLVFLALAGSALLPVSCHFGPTRIQETGATLDGTITYKGEPVLVAMVIATGQGLEAPGYVEENGKYKLLNVPLGEVKLGVDVNAAQGRLMGQRMAKQKTPKVIDIPAKYADPNTSGITTTIQKGENHFDIVILK
jgi:hypothetical protein